MCVVAVEVTTVVFVVADVKAFVAGALTFVAVVLVVAVVI